MILHPVSFARLHGQAFYTCHIAHCRLAAFANARIQQRRKEKRNYQRAAEKKVASPFTRALLVH